jgi:hypothetical protein
MLVGKLERKRTYGRLRPKWWTSIKVDLKEIGSEGAGYIQLGQNRVHWPTFVNRLLCLRVPKRRGIH